MGDIKEYVSVAVRIYTVALLVSVVMMSAVPLDRTELCTVKRNYDYVFPPRIIACWLMEERK